MSHIRLILQRQRVVGVLEQGYRVGRVCAREDAMVATDIHTVRGVSQTGVTFILIEMKVRDHVSDDHVVESVLGKAAVGETDAQCAVRPILTRGVVHACVGGVDASLLSTNVGVYDTREAQLGFEILGEDILVLACVGAIDLIHGAHSTTHSVFDRVVKGSQVCLVERLVVNSNCVRIA